MLRKRPVAIRNFAIFILSSHYILFLQYIENIANKQCSVKVDIHPYDSRNYKHRKNKYCKESRNENLQQVQVLAEQLAKKKPVILAGFSKYFVEFYKA